MAVRLTVVVCQSAMRDHANADLEETLVAELMMTPGMDATMIGPIEHVQTDDTDFICLSSFNHSLAVVSWLEPNEFRQHWQRLGLSGEVVATGEAAAAVGETRRIHHFRLEPRMQTSTLLSPLKDLLSSRSVKTVSIGLQGPASPSPKERVDAPEKVASDGKLSASASTVEDAQAVSAMEPIPAKTEVPGAKPISPTQPSNVVHHDDDEEEWEHLDRLVDDFEASDI